MILESFSLQGKVAIITGAGRGIGRGIAAGFAEAGADVVCSDLAPDGAQAAAAEARKLGRRALALACDVTDTAQVEQLAARALQEFGRVDILVNNAGGAAYCPAMKYSDKRWEGVLRLNLTAAFLCTRAVARHMMERRAGCIVNISSGNSRLPAPGMVAYSAAKAGLNAMTKTLAWELAPHVRVNSILPGAIETEGSIPALAPVIGRLVAGTPRRRMGRPRDIAMAAVFLASPAADFITGENLEVDGGMEFVYLDPSEVGSSQ